MGLRSFFQRKPASTVETAADSPPLTSPAASEPSLTPAQLAELQQAWAELNEAAKASGVKRLHACSRGGKPWQEDVATVRALATTLHDLHIEDSASGAQPER